MKLISPMTKSKQNIYGAWAIEIYSTIWVLSEYERGQIYDLPEENTSQLKIIMIMLLLLIILIIIKIITLRRREKKFKLNTKIKQRVKLCCLLFPLTCVLNVTFPNNFQFK